MLLFHCVIPFVKLHAKAEPLIMLTGEVQGKDVVMLDFLLGFAFVAMIVSPAFLASCFRHLVRMDFRLVPTSELQPAEVVRRRRV